MNRKPMIDLKRDDAIDHEIGHLVRIIEIDRGDDVRRIRIIAPWSYVKPDAWIMSLD